MQFGVAINRLALNGEGTIQGSDRRKKTVWREQQPWCKCERERKSEMPVNATSRRNCTGERRRIGQTKWVSLRGHLRRRSRKTRSWLFT